jgi:hypothetical protein
MMIINIMKIIDSTGSNRHHYSNNILSKEMARTFVRPNIEFALSVHNRRTKDAQNVQQKVWVKREVNLPLCLTKYRVTETYPVLN